MPHTTSKKPAQSSVTNHQHHHLKAAEHLEIAAKAHRAAAQLLDNIENQSVHEQMKIAIENIALAQAQEEAATKKSSHK